MVAGPERDADESGTVLDRNVGDRRQRAVAPGHAQDVGSRGPGELRRVLPFRQDVGLDAGSLGLGGKVAGSRRARARTRIDEEEGGQEWPG